MSKPIGILLGSVGYNHARHSATRYEYITIQISIGNGMGKLDPT